MEPHKIYQAIRELKELEARIKPMLPMLERMKADYEDYLKRQVDRAQAEAKEEVQAPKIVIQGNDAPLPQDQAQESAESPSQGQNAGQGTASGDPQAPEAQPQAEASQEAPQGAGQEGQPKEGDG